MAQQITTTEVRLSYVNVFVAKEDQSGRLKYGVTCLLPKTDVNGYNMLMQAIQAEAQAEANGKLKGVSIQHVKHPIHDGDGVTQNLETSAKATGCLLHLVVKIDHLQW